MRESVEGAGSGSENGVAILLSRPDHLGDILLTLPATVALRRALPSARITYVVRSGLEAVPRRCPAVDTCIPLQFPELTSEGLPESFWEDCERHASHLSACDAAVLLRPNDPWSGALFERMRVPVRVGFPQPGTRPFLTHVVPEPRGHHAMLGLELVRFLLRALGVSPSCCIEDEKDLEPWQRNDQRDTFVISDDDDREALAVIERLEDRTGPRPIVLHPGTGWRLKSWPPERWGEVAREIAKRYAAMPLVTGTDSERDAMSAVVNESCGRAVALPWTLTIGGFAALLRRSRLTVAIDSGPLHLAGLVGASVVGLYGPASGAEAGPLSPATRQRLVEATLPCRPCGQMIDPPCGAVTDPACLSRVSVDDVLDAVGDLLEARGPRDAGVVELPT